MNPILIQSQDVVAFNTQEAQELAVAPGVHHRNPLTPGGRGLARVVDGRHEYRMLHLNVAEDVLIPQAGCNSWSPSTKSFVQSDKIECGYFEVNEEMCPDEFLASCLQNISSKGARVEGVMLNSTQPLSAITAAIIVGLQTAIGSSTHKVSWFGDPNFGTSSYHSAAQVNYMERRSTAEFNRLQTMMQKIEGIDTVLRRRAGNGRIKFVNTNDGVGASTNATLPANIKDFLRDMLLQSSDALRYWYRLTGQFPVFKLQSGLFRAYIDYLQALPGGSDNHRFIVDGTPVEGTYDFEGYPVQEWADADIFDFSIGLKNPATGHSMNQRAIFCVPDNPTILTNVRATEGLESGLMIQASPLIKDKGKTWMYMTLGVGAGIAHNDLVTYGYNTSYTYPTS